MSASGGKNIPVIIGEMNICVDNNPDRGFYDATPGTFNSGLWLADFIGAASAHSNVFSIMPFSLSEEYTTSFLYADKTPKTNYYAYGLFSRYAYDTMILQKKLNGDLRVFAYKNNAGNASIFIVNWNKTDSAALNFQATNILENQGFSFTVPAWSLTCLRIEAENPVRTSYILTNNGPLPWEESTW